MNNKRNAVILMAVMALTGCAGIQMSTSPTMPASEAKAKFSVTKNDNTGIVLTVKHLAHPEKLTPPANFYVVWTHDANGAAPQNIGIMKIDKDLNGRLDAETPLHSFDLFVTAENNGQVQQPTGQHLIWITYNR